MPSISNEVESNYDRTRMPVILATACLDNDIKIWQAHTGVCEKTFAHYVSQVNALEVNPDRQLLAAASYQRIVMYDLNHAGPNHIISYDGISKNVTSLGFQEQGRWMYTGGEDGTAKIWDLRSRTLHVSRVFKVDTPVNSVVLHPNQVFLFVGDQNGVIHTWDVNSKKNEHDPVIPEAGASIQCLTIDESGERLAAINNKGNVYLYEISAGTDDAPLTLTKLGSIKAHSRYGLKIKFSPCSNYLVTTSADGSAVVWHANGTRLTTLTVPEQRWVWGAAFTADSQYVITASSDQLARTWNVKTSMVVREYVGHRKAITAMAFVDKEIT